MKRISKEERFDVQIMIYDTAGNIMQDPRHCDCGLTFGCEKCNPNYNRKSNEEANKMRRELFEVRYKRLFPL